MMFVLERQSQPEIEPFTLEEMKRHLQEYADITERDDDIEALFKAARIWAESKTGRIFVDQTWRLTIAVSGRAADGVSVWKPIDGYFCGAYEWRRVGEIWLRRSPVLEVTSFMTVDADGVEAAIDAGMYELREPDSKWPRIVSLSTATWQTEPELRVTFRAGYADMTGTPQDDASAIPETFKQAMILYAKALWDQDDKMSPLQMQAAENLLGDERVELGLA